MSLSGSPSKPDYHLVFEMKTWEDARDHCRFWFVDLAVIKSQKENDHAKSKFWLLFVQLSSNAWIGLYREPWAWQDGSLSEFRHWAPGQPNNMGGNAMCVKLVPDGFICTDCRDVYPFFCTRGEQRKKRAMHLIRSPCICCLVSNSVIPGVVLV